VKQRRKFPPTQLGNFCSSLETRLQQIERLKDAFQQVEQDNVKQWMSEIEMTSGSVGLPNV
jgi:hypothetical protein